MCYRSTYFLCPEEAISFIFKILRLFLRVFIVFFWSLGEWEKIKLKKGPYAKLNEKLIKLECTFELKTSENYYFDC